MPKIASSKNRKPPPDGQVSPSSLYYDQAQEF